MGFNKWVVIGATSEQLRALTEEFDNVDVGSFYPSSMELRIEHETTSFEELKAQPDDHNPNQNYLQLRNKRGKGRR